MKTFLFSISIIFSSLSIGQIVVEVDNNSLILYREYDNHCIVAPSENGFDELILDNGSIEKSPSGKKYSYVINPGEGTTCNLYAIKKTKKQIDTVGYRFFRVLPLPEPTLYLGSSAPGEKFHKSTIRLFCKYSAEIPIVDIKFDIVSWEFSHNDKLITGVSNEFSAEVLNYIAEIPSGESINIMATVKQPNGKTKRISGTYTLY
jgi:hypothetical protein